MGMDIAKLFARIGIKADVSQGETLLKQIKEMKIGLGVASISAAAFVLALKAITNEAFQTALNFKKFNLETGASTDELQKWMAVADETTGSGQAVAESIKSITANQEKIKLGQGNISGYQLLGINPSQDPFKILEQLRTKTAGLNQAMKKNVMEQMGVSKDLIGVLELTNKQFDEMAARAFIIPASSLKEIDKARASTEELKNAVNYFKAMLTASLGPSIIKINKLIVEWIRNNKDGLIKDIKTLFTWITKFVGAIVNTVMMIDKIIKGTIGWGNAMWILIGVIAVLNAALIFSPMGAFIAGIVLLVAVLDDLAVYSRGGKSLFGLMLDKNPKLKEFVTAVKDLAKALADVMNGDWSKFDKLMESWGAWGTAVSIIVKGLTQLYDTIIAIDKLRFGGPPQALVDEKNKEQERKNREKESPTTLTNTNKNVQINNNNNVKVDIHGNANKKDTTDGVKDGLNEANKNLDGQLRYSE
jgi:hypothetical protein